MFTLRKTGSRTLTGAAPAGRRAYERKYSSNSTKGSSAGRLVFATVAGTSAVVGGGLAYSYVDPEFRSSVETKVPVTKSMFKAVLGERASATIQGGISSSTSVRPFIDTSKGSNKERLDRSVSPISAKTTSSTTAITPITTVDKSAEKAVVSRDRSLSPGRDTTLNSESKSNEVVSVPPVLARSDSQKKSASSIKKNPYVGKEDGIKKNQALEESLKGAIANAESNVRAATAAKLETIRAVEHHVQTIREAIESGPSGDWDAVVVAHAAAERKTREDMEAERAGRTKVDSLEKVINLGAQGETTVLHPLLAVARETVTKLKTEMDEMENMIKKIGTERVFVRDYGHLVEEGRKKFAKELRAVMPSADWTGDLQSMKREQLSALIAHAHLRVDQLNRKLIENKLSEDNRIHQMIEKMKKEKMEKVKEVVVEKVVPGKVDEELLRIKNDFDKELQKRLDEAQQRYDKQLQEVVVTQKKLYDIEHAKDVDTAVLAERSVHATSIGRALAHLEGIEAALKARSIQDAENRRAKQMWLAVHNLVESVEYGKKSACCMEGRRIPLDPRIKVLLKNSDGDQFMQAVSGAMNKITKVRGEYTTEDLVNRFDKVFRVGHRVAGMDVNGGGVLAHLFSWLKSSLSFQLPLTYSEKDKIDADSESNSALLDRARYFMKNKQYLNAVKVLQKTKGPTRGVADDFISDTRRHEEALMLARLMLAHAAVTSIRSTY